MWMCIPLVNPRCACACVSFCYPTSHFTSHESLHKQYQVFSIGYRSKRVFSETAVFESCGVNTSEKAYMLIRTGLYFERVRSLCVS